MGNKKETPAQIAERALRNFKDDTPIPVLLDAVEKALSESLENKKSEHSIFDSEDFKKGDFLVAYVPNLLKICVFINLKETLSVQDVFLGIPAYAILFFDKLRHPDLQYKDKIYLPKNIVRIRHASEEEKECLNKSLKNEGLEWDAEKCELVKSKWEPKEGDKVFSPHCIFYSGKFKVAHHFWNDRAKLGRRDWVFRTEEEAQALCDKLNESIKEANLPKEKPTHAKVMSEEEIRLVVEDMKKTLRVPAITYKDLIDIVNIYNSIAVDEFKICDTPPKISISEEERMKTAKKNGWTPPEEEWETKL